MMLHARGIEHQTKGVDNVLAGINLGLATGKFGSPAAASRPSLVRATARAGASTATVRPAARQPRHREPRAPGRSRRRLGSARSEIPRKGSPPRDHRGDPRRQIRGCFDLLQPARLVARHRLHRRGARPARLLLLIDFFLSESAQHADLVLAGSLHEEDEGTSTSAEGRVIGSRRRRLRPARRASTGRSCSISPNASAGDHFRFAPPRDLRRAAPGVQGRHGRLLGHHLGADRARARALLARPRGRSPRHAAPLRGWKFLHPDGRPAFTRVRTGPPAEVVDAEYPVILTTGRVVSQFLWGTQTRRIGALVDQYPVPQCEIHPRLAVARHPRRRAGTVSRRGQITLPAHVVTTIRPDTVFIPYHWPGGQSANQLTVRAYDPLAGIPSSRSRPCGSTPAMDRSSATALEAI